MAKEPSTIVRMKQGAGPVTLLIRFDLSDIGADWSYKYATETGTLSGKSTDAGGPVRAHPLGTVSSLHLDAHEWDIVVARVGEEEPDVEVTLTWSQDVDDDGDLETLHTRAHKTKLKEGNEGELFQSGVFLVAVGTVGTDEDDANDPS